VPLPEIAPREDAGPTEPNRPQDEVKAPFLGLFGFSIIGLLLCLILTRMPISRSYQPLEICLIFVAGPLAAWLGFSLGGHD